MSIFGKSSPIDKKYAVEYDAWKKTPTPKTTGALLKKMQPSIDRGISANVGKNVSPVLRSRARRLALDAVRTFSPTKGTRLSTHVINHMKGLRRIARKQQQVLRVPERVALDQNFLYTAEAELSDKLGREPSINELADHTKISSRRIEQVRKYRNPMAEGSLLDVTDQNPEGYSPAVEQSSISNDTTLRAAYDDMSATNQKIMEWTLGIYGKKPVSNRMIADRLRMTPGAVSQRKAQIQAKIDEMQNFGMF